MYILSSAMIFLLDPSPIIIYRCQWLTLELNYCCLVDLADVTLAFEDVNSNLLYVVSVADVYAEEHVNILKLRFEPEFWSQYWRWSLVKVLKYVFRQDFEAEIWWRFLS